MMPKCEYFKFKECEECQFIVGESNLYRNYIIYGVMGFHKNEDFIKCDLKEKLITPEQARRLDALNIALYDKFRKENKDDN